MTAAEVLSHRVAHQVLQQFGSIADDGIVASPDVAAMEVHGLLGVLCAAAEDGTATLSVDGSAMLDALLESSTTEAVRLEARAAAALKMLDECGIEARVLKGVAVARLDYADPDLRHFGDVDLLVSGADMPAAVSAFEKQGYTRHFAEPFRGFDANIGKGVAVGDDSRTVFDLHRTLALGYYGTRLPVADLWLGNEPFDVAGRRALALTRTQRFVHAALHLALTPHRRMANGLDLVVISSKSPVLTAGEILEVAARWGCLHPLAIALDVTIEWFGIDWMPAGLVEWSASHHPRVADRLVMSTFDGPIASSHLRSLTSVAGLRSNTQRRTAIRGLLARGQHERE